MDPVIHSPVKAEEPTFAPHCAEAHSDGVARAVVPTPASSGPLAPAPLPAEAADPTSVVPDKRLVQLRFEQAAATYEQQAQVQLLVAERLLDLLRTTIVSPPIGRVLEIGCCTGLLTEKIMTQFPDLGHLTAIDLVDSFAHCVAHKTGLLGRKALFLAGDIETIRLPDRYDLIISSSTLQWMHDLPGLCRKLGRHLQPDGVLAVSLYGWENMREIRALTGVGLRYLNLEQLLGVVQQDFQILAAKQSLETLWFQDAISVLKHLRATGVNSIGPRPWTRRQLHMFLSDYREQFSDPQGVRLTYHPMYVIGRPRA